MIKSVTQNSSANSPQTITITKSTGVSRIFIRHITVATKGGDVSADIDIVLNDNAVAKWATAYRSAKIFGGTFDLGKGFPIVDGDATIVIDSGGAGVITVASIIYEII